MVSNKLFVLCFTCSVYFFFHMGLLATELTLAYLSFKSSNVTMVQLYVDDIILTGSHPNIFQSFSPGLSKQFATKDLGELHYFLSIEVYFTRSSCFSDMHLNSSPTLKCWKRNYAQFQILLAPSCLLSIRHGESLSNPSLLVVSSNCGSIQQLMMTRPNLTYIVNQACTLQQLFTYRP